MANSWASSADIRARAARMSERGRQQLVTAMAKHAEVFEGLIPWPALAESFRADERFVRELMRKAA